MAVDRRPEFRVLFLWAAGLLLGLSVPVTPAAAQSSATDTIGFEIEVEPAFFLDLVSEGGNILVSPMVPDRPASDAMRVVVRTNRGQPYRILHTLEEPLRGPDGRRIDPGAFLFSASDGLHGGRSRVPHPVPLKSGRSVVFLSNRRGDADEFLLTYTAPGRSVIASGRYRGRVEVEWELQ
ncbi:MAG: hypothetical protein COV76_05250 [Candidatus Omnitrophica bacterium CG11_big_fil_rev_8_21_14_0_20_64_10]|nr:MAG: hypothetical protein COV76_05250 [Candidatus Omnitrophica bacterium CG11_big_fil_rev_8_21_14_0_20_64_10]